MTLLAVAVVLTFGSVGKAASLPATGPHRVSRTVIKLDRTQSTRLRKIEVWYPSDQPDARFPLLLFSPGFGNKPADYSFQLDDLASHGYVVAGLDHAADSVNSFELRAILWAQDILAAKRVVLLSPLHKRIDVNQIGAFGHSHGGRSAAAACLLDSTIRACLNQDGQLDDIQLRRPYWPISGHQFAGSFALLDWFDPGLEDEDFRLMNTTRKRYAAARLAPDSTALQAFRAVRGGAYHITLLTPGMEHTAFTDIPWSRATSESQRAQYAAYLRQIRAATVAFFNHTLKKIAPGPVCDGSENGVQTQCFAPNVP
jgi:hypothetical protein